MKKRQTLILSFLFLLDATFIALSTRTYASPPQNLIDQILFIAQPKIQNQTTHFPKNANNQTTIFQILTAEIALNKNQPSKALDIYLKLAKETLDPRIAERATEIAILQNKAQKALVAAKIWYKITPKSLRTQQILAILYSTTGRLYPAQSLFQKILATIPPNKRLDAILKIQKIIEQSPNKAAQLTVLNNILAPYRNLSISNIILAKQAIISNQQAFAFSYIKAALKQHENYLDIAILLSEMESNYRTFGIQVFQKLRKKYSENPNISSGLALIFLKNDQAAQAIATLKTYLQKNPRNFKLTMQLALTYINTNQIQLAQSLLQNFVKTNPKETDISQAYLLLAKLALNDRQYNIVEHWLNKIQPTSSQFNTAQIMLSETYLCQNKLLKAHNALNLLENRLLPLNQVIQAEQLLTEILIRQQHYQHAYQNIKSFIIRHPNNTKLLYSFAIAANKMKYYDQADQALLKIIDIEPQNFAAYNALGYALLQRNENLKQAAQYIEKAYSLSQANLKVADSLEKAYLITQANLAVVDSLGWLRVKQGKFKQAIPLLKHAFQALPNAEFGAHLGEALWLNHEKTQATKVWQKAWEIDPKNPELLAIFKQYQFQPSPNAKN